MLYRISKTAWLKEEEHENVGHVYTRTHQVTGLNMETSEELQVSNYGIGGHYEPHFDFARREETNAFASPAISPAIIHALPPAISEDDALAISADLSCSDPHLSSPVMAPLTRTSYGVSTTTTVASPVSRGNHVFFF